MNFLKKIYPQNFKRVILAVMLIIAVTSLTMGAVYDVALKNVTLVQIDEFNGIGDNEKVKTRKLTVGEFLEENKIEIGENDLVSKGLEEEIVDEDVLVIRKGRVVELSVDGKVEIVTVTKATVGDAIEEIGVTLSKDDVVTPDVNSEIENEMLINIDRISHDEVIETEEIGFETKKVNDKTLAKGKTKVSKKGQKGEKQIKYSVKKVNGEVVSKEKISEEITKKPVDEVIKVGTKSTTTKKSNTKTVSTGKTKAKDFSYSKKFTMKATAYDSSLSENGGNARTAYGLVPQYGVVAVDPKVIPLGTKLYIESSDGGKSWVYGYCIAGDTGGAIKGNKVDLCFNSKSECTKFGRKTATVYVLN